MDILIKGMEKPKNFPYRLTIEADGTVKEHNFGYKGTAIELKNQLISVHKVCDYLAERADESKEMGDDGMASLFASMIGDILAISTGVDDGHTN